MAWWILRAFCHGLSRARSGRTRGFRGFRRARGCPAPARRLLPLDRLRDRHVRRQDGFPIEDWRIGNRLGDDLSLRDRRIDFVLDVEDLGLLNRHGRFRGEIHPGEETNRPLAIALDLEDALLASRTQQVHHGCKPVLPLIEAIDRAAQMLLRLADVERPSCRGRLAERTLNRADAVLQAHRRYGQLLFIAICVGVGTPEGVPYGWPFYGGALCRGTLGLARLSRG